MKRNGNVLQFCLLLIVALSFSLIGCSGGGGGGGSTTGGASGQNSVVTAIRNSAPASVCPNGGISVDAGIDTNSNAVLDPAEVTSTQYVCNGTTGAIGANGSDGFSALVKVSDEPAGAHCATGGKKISVGIDVNKNGVLDTSEITSSDYICNGAAGPAGPTNTYGTVTGVVTSTTGSALPGVVVSNSLTPDTATTLANGSFSLTLPAGSYSLTFTKNYYTTGTAAANVAINITTTVNAALSEAGNGRPSISLAASGAFPGYGATVNLIATASDPNGGDLSYTWSGATGNGPNATTTSPTLAESFAYRLDPVNPGGYIAPHALEDRFGVLPISPDTRGAKTVSVTINDGQGQSVSQSITVYAAGIQSGLRTVPLGARVYLNSGHDGASAWAINAAPNGSIAALNDPSVRTPFFVPDLAGSYTVTEGSNSMDIYASAWSGAVGGGSGDTVTPYSQCLLCHNGLGLASDKFTPWLNTKHATVFTRGINGSTSSDGTCVACHTVGYDTTAANNGYDDSVTDAGWSYPSVRQPGNWDDLTAAAPSVARMVNVQCESCHGPNTAGSHMVTMTTGSAAPMNERISYGAEVCAQCHASGSDYNIASQCATANPDTGNYHADLPRAMTVAASATGLNSSCGRCHSAQGFRLFALQLKAGNVSLQNVPAAVLSKITPTSIQPITCAACHDSHDATNPNQLRFYDSTPNLPSGFSVAGLGKGALCVACHNSRNGAQSGSSTLTYLHEDGQVYNAGNPTGYSIPHQSTQGDVLMGRNAYFMGSGNLPLISQHANVTDSCVGCHMVQNPQKRLVNGETRVNEHVMYLRDADRAVFCAGCHTATDGSALAAATDNLLQQLQTKMGAASKTKINGLGTIKVRAWDEATDYYSSSSSGNSNITIDTVSNPVMSVVVTDIHGQMGVFVTLTNPLTIQFVDGSGSPLGAPKDVTTFGVQIGSLKDGANAVLYALSGNMIRAGWNYFLVQYDASRGIHNPTFVGGAVRNALTKDLSN